MTARTARAVLVVWSVLAVGGCAYVPYRNLNAFGARELLVDKDNIEEIKLVRLLVGSNARPSSTQHPRSSHNPPERQNAAADTTEISIDEAFRAFYQTTPKEELTLRRNAIQERILAASAQRCGTYFKFVNQFATEVGFSLGALTTTLAGAGAIVTPATAARALAGTAGITSGVGAEFQEKFFSKLTVQVITKGIEKRREAIYDQIKKDRESADYENYPVEAAVKDALRYHSACNLLIGLEEAADSLERAKNPGLTQMREFLKSYGELRKELQQAVEKESEKKLEATPPKVPDK